MQPKISAGGIDRNLDDLSNDRPNFTGDASDIQSWGRMKRAKTFPLRPAPFSAAGEATVLEAAALSRPEEPAIAAAGTESA